MCLNLIKPNLFNRTFLKEAYLRAGRDLWNQPFILQIKKLSPRTVRYLNSGPWILLDGFSSTPCWLAALTCGRFRLPPSFRKCEGRGELWLEKIDFPTRTPKRWLVGLNPSPLLTGTVNSNHFPSYLRPLLTGLWWWSWWEMGTWSHQSPHLLNPLGISWDWEPALEILKLTGPTGFDGAMPPWASGHLGPWKAETMSVEWVGAQAGKGSLGGTFLPTRSWIHDSISWGKFHQGVFLAQRDC